MGLFDSFHAEKIFPVTMAGPDSFMLDGEEYQGKPHCAGREFAPGEKSHIVFTANQNPFGGPVGRRMPVIFAGATRRSWMVEGPRGALAFGLWQQSEGFPTLLGGPLSPSNMPSFGSSSLFNPGFPSGAERRIGWSGMALASSGADRLLLYLSTAYNDDAETDPNEDAIGLVVNEWNLGAGTLAEYTIAFPSPFDSDPGAPGTSPWFPHRLGSFFYNPEDDLITIATPFGLYCMSREQDSQVLTPWASDVSRASHDLAFSCGWFQALQHGWAEQEGASGPDLRGWIRARNSKDWVDTWTRTLASLCGTLTPGRIFQSGQTDRYTGFVVSNDRVTYDPENQRWMIGISLAEDSEWVGSGGGGGLTGRAGIVISTLAGSTGATVNTYTIEALTSDAVEVRPGMLAEALEAANELQAARLADQKALVTSEDSSPKDQFSNWGPGGPGWPTKFVTVTSYPGANPTRSYSFPALYHVVLSGASLPSTISGGVIPAPSLDGTSLFPLFSPTNGHVRLRKGDDGNFWTVVFKNRQVVTGYSFTNEAEIHVPYGSFPGESLTYEVLSSGADLVGDGYEGGGSIQSQTLILTRTVPLLADIDHDSYETLLLCLSPSLVEISRTDLSLRFLGLYADSIAGPQTVPVPSWRNVSDWAIRGRVIFILRDFYRSDTEGAALDHPLDFKPYLQILELSTLEELHRIEIYEDDEDGSGGKLISGIQAAGDLEWAEVACAQGATTRLLRVQMQAGLTDTPDTYRHTRTDQEFPAPSDEWDHQVVYSGATYWPSNFGAIYKST